jgi:CheY-like chemotaxis protein
MITILFADNNSEFLKTRSEFLEKAGYSVIPALNPAEAREALGRGGIDLAIIDIRLVNDDDEKDNSGLALAKDAAFKPIPKIILTGFPSVNAVRESLKPQKNGSSAAIDFVSKEDGPDALIASIKRSIAIHIDREPIQVYLNVSDLLEKEYEEARKQAVLTHRVRLVLLVIGSLVIIGGAIGVILGYTTAGALSAVSGAVVDGIAALFWKFSEDANKRMDECRKELLDLYKEKK